MSFYKKASRVNLRKQWITRLTKLVREGMIVIELQEYQGQDSGYRVKFLRDRGESTPVRYITPETYEHIFKQPGIKERFLWKVLDFLWFSILRRGQKKKDDATS